MADSCSKPANVALSRDQVAAMDDTMTREDNYWPGGQGPAMVSTEDALTARLAWFDKVLAQNCMPATSRLTLEQRRNDTEQQLCLLIAARHKREAIANLTTAIWWVVMGGLCVMGAIHFAVKNWPGVTL